MNCRHSSLFANCTVKIVLMLCLYSVGERAYCVPIPGRSWGEFFSNCLSSFEPQNPYSNLNFSPIPPFHIALHARNLGMKRIYGADEFPLFWKNLQIYLKHFYENKKYTAADYIREIGSAPLFRPIKNDLVEFLDWSDVGLPTPEFAWRFPDSDPFIETEFLGSATPLIKISPVLTLYSEVPLHSAIYILSELKELKLAVRAPKLTYTTGMSYVEFIQLNLEKTIQHRVEARLKGFQYLYTTFERLRLPAKLIPHLNPFIAQAAIISLQLEEKDNIETLRKLIRVEIENFIKDPANPIHQFLALRWEKLSVH